MLECRSFTRSIVDHAALPLRLSLSRSTLRRPLFSFTFFRLIRKTEKGERAEKAEKRLGAILFESSPALVAIACQDVRVR